MDRYQYILNRMLSNQQGEISDQEMERLKKAARVNSKLSFLHHYIPQYYIKGFTGGDGMLSVYDKQRDEIKKGRKGSKGVFFEKDRHTISFDDMKTSMIEDKFFADVDTQHAPHIKYLREHDDALTLPDTEGSIASFVVDLFWRNPLSDYAFENLFSQSTIKFTDPLTGEMAENAELEKRYKADPVQFKIEKSKMFLTAMNDILKDRISGSSWSSTWTFSDTQLLIGDYPMLFEGTPSTHKDLFTMNYILPVSSRKVYISCNKKVQRVTLKDAHLLNALIIDQSKKMVCCADPELLKNCVAYYKLLKQKIFLPAMKKILFARITDEDRPLED